MPGQGGMEHLYEPGMTYLLTAVTFKRIPLFSDAPYASIAHADVAFYAAKFALTSLAHVVMPDHIHWIVCPSADDFVRFAARERERGGKYASAPERFYLSKIMEDYKRHVAFEINRSRDTRGAQVWQDGFRDDGLRNADAVRSAMEYVIMNPVKAGLVAVPEAYPYLAWLDEWWV